MKLYETLEYQLKKENNFVTDEGELKKWVVIGKARNYDPLLIKLLLENDTLKEKFFVEVEGTLVFKQEEFITFMEMKNYLNDSYTQYKNKVGLTIDGKYVKQRNEVELVWPYKDCVLEGGQNKEEQKREEIFFNGILAQDEITQLFEPKVLTNAKVYDKEGEHKFSCFTRDAELNKKRRLPEDTITDNLIIKGNNLLALHSLKKEFAGKVKLIYIDPPYNTGNDGFKYNDSFNHSSWLTFMKNRLEVAKELLRDDGVIFVQIDNSPNDMQESPELGYLLVLMDEVFKRKNYIGIQIWKKKGNASNTEKNIGTITETILMYAKKFDSISFNLQEYKRNYKYEENGKFYNLEKPIKTNNGTYERKTMLFGIKTKEGIFYPPNGKRWTIGEEKAKEYVKNNKYKIVDGEFYIKKFEEDYKKGEFKLFNNLLENHGSLKSAKNELKKLGFNREDFDSPKPELLIERLLQISTQKNDIVLDYHLGSGTTAATAHKMNRQYIGIEQMDYIETVAVERLKKVIEGEQGGISKSVNWQGGGSFIYLELKKYNQTFIEQIEEAKDTETLLQIWEKMKERSFLNYNVDLKKQEEHIEEFKQLSIEEQKQHLVEILDKNQLYVNLSSLNDKDFECTDEEKHVTKDFYRLDK